MRAPVLYRYFFKITVPLLKNIMVFVMLTSIIGGLQLLEEPMQLFSGWATSSTQLGGPGSSCLTVMWYLYDTAFGTTMRQGLEQRYRIHSLLLLLFLHSSVTDYLTVERMHMNKSRKHRLQSVLETFFAALIVIILMLPFYIMFMMGTYSSQKHFGYSPLNRGVICWKI